MNSIGGFDAGFGVLNIISLVFSLAVLGANVWMLIDATQRPDWAHQSAGSNKGLWIGLGVGSLVLCLCCWVIAAIAPIVWLTAYRPKVVDAERRGPYGGYGPPGGFGGPPPGYDGGSGGHGPPGGFGSPPGPPPGYGPPTEWGQPGGGHPPFGGGPRNL